MAEGDVVDLVEDQIEAGWKWLTDEARAIYYAVQPLWAVPLKAFETDVVQRLWGAAAALVQRLMSVQNLADLETALLNTLSRLGGGLIEAAKALGSNLLQATLGLLQAHVAASA